MLHGILDNLQDIRIGLKRGLDISTFLSPDFSPLITFSSPSFWSAPNYWKIQITFDMSTSPNAISAFMLSFSKFACLVSEQHYHFLLQSLNNLEHQIEQHWVERHLMELQQQTTQWCPDAMSTSSTSWTPSLLSDIESEPIDDPSTIMSLLRTPLHTTFWYMTCHLIKGKTRYQTPERPIWDQEGTQSTFSMMMRYNVRDVGRKDISLGIVTKSIKMMGSNTSQLSGKRIWWNQHMLLTGTTINENTQDFKQGHSGPSQNHDPPPLRIPFSCCLSGTNASSPCTQ